MKQIWLLSMLVALIFAGCAPVVPTETLQAEPAQSSRRED